MCKGKRESDIALSSWLYEVLKSNHYKENIYPFNGKASLAQLQ